MIYLRWIPILSVLLDAQHRTFREYQRLPVCAGFDDVSRPTPFMIFGRKTDH
jgi:hypothetical protein